MRTFYQDLRFGLRVLRSSLGFTSVVVITLALGVIHGKLEVRL